MHRFAARLCIICATLCVTTNPSASPADTSSLVHGLWVWKSSAVLQAPHSAESLRDFCKSQNINEVYISVSAQRDSADETRLARLITLLHRSEIRVEGLLSSADADEPGKHREKFLDHVRGIIQFNEKHPAARFDGIHLDIEPQQRAENKGPGNLRFFPGLVDAYRAALALSESAHLSINADIQNKLLKGDLRERKMLLTALPRLTLMLYELSSPGDGETPEQKSEKLRSNSQKYLDMAYDGLAGPHLAQLVIGLRTPDYADLLPRMLQSLDESNRPNPHYGGWARHSYNDYLNAAH